MLSTKSRIMLEDDRDLVRALCLVLMNFAHFGGDPTECLDIAALAHKYTKLKSGTRHLNRSESI